MKTPSLEPAPIAAHQGGSAVHRQPILTIQRAWVLLPAFCGAMLSLLLYRMATDREVWLVASRWLTFSIWPVFYDLSITLSHLHQAAVGIDPLSDPESEFAYPRTVLLLRYLGVHHVPAAVLGLAQGLMLTLALVLVLRPFTLRRAIATSLLFFTPAILLGMERANFDFALFLLCAVAAWQWSRATRSRNLGWPIIAVIAGGLLKLYPAFALAGAALVERGRRRLFWLLGAAAVGGYWLFNAAELALIKAKVPLAPSASWGCLVFFKRLQRYLLARYEDLWVSQLPWLTIGLVAYAIAGAAAVFVGLRATRTFRAVRVERDEWAFYWIGVGICCGCFVGINFAYRWIFVLLALPLLLRNLRSREPRVSLWARVTVATMLFSLSVPLRADGGLFVLGQIANWICLLLLIVGCAALHTRGAPPARIKVAPARANLRVAADR